MKRRDTDTDTEDTFTIWGYDFDGTPMILTITTFDPSNETE